MTVMESLMPISKPRVMDLVEEASVDIGDWSNFKGGKEKASTNPKYCYNWSFSEPGKVVVLNIWLDSLEEVDNSIRHVNSYRKSAKNIDTKPVWMKRANEMDKHIQYAFDNKLPVRIIICVGRKRRKDDPLLKASVVTARMLDPVEWAVTAYNKKTGQAAIVRRSSPLLATCRRVLFARIGYMKYYAGSQDNDEKPLGGGKYNKLHTGHEIFNFKDVNGELFGYFQPYLKNNEMHRSKVNLEKIEPKNTEDKIDDVLVIFFSTLPDTGGQVIVGWYKNATVWRDYQSSKRRYLRDNYSYNLAAKTSDCVLLPPESRVYQIAGRGLKQTGRPGQSNAFYILDDKVRRKKDKWIKEAIAYVDSYNTDNLLDLDRIDIEIQRKGTDQVEQEVARSTGQAFNSSVKARKAIEDYSMKKARKYFENDCGYKFERDTSKNHSYDLEFSKQGKLLHVEVKGTQLDGSNVFLTRNEVIHARESGVECALYILHSINVTETRNKCTCAGGKSIVLQPWRIKKSDLKPITYQYTVSKE